LENLINLIAGENAKLIYITIKNVTCDILILMLLFSMIIDLNFKAFAARNV